MTSLVGQVTQQVESLLLLVTTSTTDRDDDQSTAWMLHGSSMLLCFLVVLYSSQLFQGVQWMWSSIGSTTTTTTTSGSKQHARNWFAAASSRSTSHTKEFSHHHRSTSKHDGGGGPLDAPFLDATDSSVDGEDHPSIHVIPTTTTISSRRGSDRQSPESPVSRHPRNNNKHRKRKDVASFQGIPEDEVKKMVLPDSSKTKNHDHTHGSVEEDDVTLCRSNASQPSSSSAAAAAATDAWSPSSSFPSPPMRNRRSTVGGGQVPAAVLKSSLSQDHKLPARYQRCKAISSSTLVKTHRQRNMILLQQQQRKRQEQDDDPPPSSEPNDEIRHETTEQVPADRSRQRRSQFVTGTQDSLPVTDITPSALVSTSQHVPPAAAVSRSYRSSQSMTVLESSQQQVVVESSSSTNGRAMSFSSSNSRRRRLSDGPSKHLVEDYRLLERMMRSARQLESHPPMESSSPSGSAAPHS